MLIISSVGKMEESEHFHNLLVEVYSLHLAIYYKSRFFIYFWLCSFFIVACQLLSIAVHGFLTQRLLLLQNTSSKVYKLP